MLTFNVADFPPSSVDPDGPSLPWHPPHGLGPFQLGDQRDSGPRL
jgi:hypothetical protein